MPPRTRAYLLLLGTALIWGWASPVVKYSTNYIPPLIMLAYRFAISAFIALLFYPTYRRHLPKKLKDWIYTLIYGFLVSTVTLSLYFVGVKNSSSIVAAMGSVFQPVLASIGGIIFLREHVTHREKTGLTVALIGSLIITFEPLFANGLGQHLGTLLGNLLLIFSRFSDVAGALLSKTILRLKVSPLALTHISFITGFFTLLPLLFFFHPPAAISHSLLTAPFTAHLGVFYMALLSGTLAYTWFHAAEKTIEIGEASVSYYLHPLFAAPLSFFWLKEPLTPTFLFGCLIVSAGVVLAETKKSRR